MPKTLLLVSPIEDITCGVVSSKSKAIYGTETEILNIALTTGGTYEFGFHAAQGSTFFT